MVESRLHDTAAADGEALDSVFRALADTSRRQMLRRLSERPLSIGELGAPLDMSFAGASKHVRVLEAAGLVTRQRNGRRHLCRLVPGRLAQAHRWLSFYQQFWADRLDTLAAVLQRDAATPGDTAPGDTPVRRRTRRRKTS